MEPKKTPKIKEGLSSQTLPQEMCCYHQLHGEGCAAGNVASAGLAVKNSDWKQSWTNRPCGFRGLSWVIRSAPRTVDRFGRPHLRLTVRRISFDGAWRASHSVRAAHPRPSVRVRGTGTESGSRRAGKSSPPLEMLQLRGIRIA